MEQLVIYSEVQRFNQWWIRLIQISLFVFFTTTAVMQLGFGVRIGSQPVSNIWMIVLFVVFGVLMPVLFRLFVLQISVRADGVWVRFFPIHFKNHCLHEIISCEVKTFRPIADYGGWGIRYGASGKAYLISGNTGVMLTFVNGKKILLGSQNPDKLASAINSIL